ncbi:MAG: hypothetical protein H0U92_03845 [Actinobacteria bacterium]|nr:hypothetical protein [Actinomycetota bacterium]
MSPTIAVLDDRLLIEELLRGLRVRRVELHTTSYWYYRACRAAVLGAGGQLSGPFEKLDAPEQASAIASLLRLRDDIALPDPRPVVPTMVAVAARHPRLNLMNLEAAAVGLVLGAVVWLSPKAAAGVLPPVLDAEGVRWKVGA